MSTPDFFIIGAMKCGTSSLHDQLAGQAGIFMSTPKEPNYFSDDDVFAQGRSWYENLFAAAPAGALKGESSTHYTKRPTHPHTIDRLADHVTDAKFIYVMRHPIDRLVSHYIHEWTQNVLTQSIDAAVREHEPLIAYSRYAWQLAPWVERFGRDRILPVFFERMTTAPQETLSRIGTFLGRPDLTWRDDIRASNQSAERVRHFPFYDMVVANPVAAGLRRALVPRSIRDKVKSNFQITDRPEISDDIREHLEEMFDRDLAALGAELGISLDCATFKDTVRKQDYQWAD